MTDAERRALEDRVRARNKQSRDDAQIKRDAR